MPAIYPNVDMMVFPLLGRVLSHGFLVCSFLPVQVAFPINVAALLMTLVLMSVNALSGLSHRPIAHTCASLLELPRTYSTCLEVCEEFTAFLSNEFSGIIANI